VYLVLIWILFIVFTSITEIDEPHYLLFSTVMFYITYIHNQIIPNNMSLRTCTILISIPSFIMSYMAERYNSFLCLNPINDELFMTLVFIYWYLIIHIISERN
jgi:hypothetical protein